MNTNEQPMAGLANWLRMHANFHHAPAGAVVSANTLRRWADEVEAASLPQGDVEGLMRCDIKPRALSDPLSDYHRAMSEGPLHFTWKDKPHRLVYDLIAAVRYYALAGRLAAPQPQPAGVPPASICPHGIHMNNACGACIPPRGTLAYDAVRNRQPAGWTDLSATSPIAPAAQPEAWMTEDGERVVTARTKAANDIGAGALAMRGYTVPLFRTIPAAPSPETKES